MRCGRCEQEAPHDADFCPECGAKLTAVCGGCGTANAPNHKFCKKCGHLLAAPGEPDGGARVGWPRPHIPEHLAQKILTSKTALEGERKQVTVLFADLKGSLEMLADRDPEEVRRILDPVLERMMEAVHRYEGTVNQVMGDGIMALFGAPLAHEDHAVRACYAALRMQESVRRYGDEVRRSLGAALAIRVGLNSGEVVVRAIRNDLQMDYSAIGETTHLAARMEQAALPGTILMTAETLRLAEGYVQPTPLGPVAVKGLSAPIAVYEVTGSAVAATRLLAAAARGLTPFVGRALETEQLRGALEEVRQGRGQVVAVVGEPGVGKSRLFYEFVRSHHVHGCRVMESRSMSYGKATPYLPAIELLKTYFGVQAHDGQREVREKVTGKLLTLDEMLQPSRTALLALLDVPVDDPPWHMLDPPGRRQRTLDAIKRLLLRESREQPLILVFEDLHWLDSETQALLDGIVESLPTTRTLLLVNYRPEYQHDWGNKTYYTQCRMAALPAATADALLDSLLGNDPSVRPLMPFLMERTDGNPLFLEESVRSLVEVQSLVGERGAYRLTRPVKDVQVPPTVHAILAARLDRLPTEAKTLLQAASVIGKDIPIAVLEAVGSLPEPALRDNLARLQGAEFLYETRLFPDLEYTFKHALTHEVTYRSLLHERRRVLHGDILDAIERLFPDRFGERVEELARHAFGGEVWDKAMGYSWQAGAKALARSANRDAVAFFEQALAALDRLPTTSARNEQAIDLRFHLRSALMPLGEFHRTRDVLTEAETLAKALGDSRRMARGAGNMANLFWEMGQQEQAVAAGQRALDIAETLGDDDLRDLAHRYLGRSFHAIGDYPRAIEILANAARSRPRSAVPVLSHEIFLVFCLAETGGFVEGIAHGNAALQAAEHHQQPVNLTAVCSALGRLYLRKGDLEKSIGLLERGVALCEAATIPLLFPMAAAPLGAAYAQAGRVLPGLALLQQAAERAVTMGRMVDQALWVAWLSEALFRAGRVDEAFEHAGRARDLALAHRERPNHGWSLRILGELFAERDHEQAEDHYRHALAIADELGMRPLQAHCHLGLGVLCERQRRSEEARAALVEARRLFSVMEMSSWLGQAEAAWARPAAPREM
jgi:class 3 adenylate cyclase/tetratricopeptide (TPR) repeat protein